MEALFHYQIQCFRSTMPFLTAFHVQAMRRHAYRGRNEISSLRDSQWSWRLFPAVGEQWLADRTTPHAARIAIPDGGGCVLLFFRPECSLTRTHDECDIHQHGVQLGLSARPSRELSGLMQLFTVGSLKFTIPEGQTKFTSINDGQNKRLAQST